MEEGFPHPESQPEKEDNDSIIPSNEIKNPSYSHDNGGVIKDNHPKDNIGDVDIHVDIDMKAGNSVVQENGSGASGLKIIENGAGIQNGKAMVDEIKTKNEVKVEKDVSKDGEFVAKVTNEVHTVGEESSIAPCGDGDVTVITPAPVEKKAIVEILIDDDGPLDAESTGNQRRGTKRKPGEPFPQAQSCLKASQYLPKCRDCVARGKDKNSVSSVFDVCRFQAFRKLVRKPSSKMNGAFFIEFDGFCDPDLDPIPSDIEIWMPNPSNPPTELPQAVCLQLLEHLGDQVCAMIRQEEEALAIEAAFPNKKKFKWWKRLVDGIREMCDVCATTLFNYHWICSDCGFVACLDCFKARQQGTAIIQPTREHKDHYTWLHCCVDKDAISKVNHSEAILKKKQAEAAIRHQLQRLELTQIIPGNCLQEFNKLLHQVRGVWNIPQNCDCSYAKEFTKISGLDSSISHVNQEVNWSEDRKPAAPAFFVSGSTCNSKNKMEESSDEEDDEENCFGEVSFTPISTQNKDIRATSAPQPEDLSSNQNSNTSPIPPSSTEIKEQPDKPAAEETAKPKWKKNIPKKVFYKTDTEKEYPGLPHSWYCSGSLLKLEDPNNEKNTHIFQDVWKRGQPVLVSNVSDKLNSDLWSPESFLKDYGEDRNDLVNCLTGKELKNEKIETFWKGFSDVKERITDARGIPMLLKLKDWPATEDFAKFSPKRFDDLMQALPLKEYTHRTGRLNLAARLPSSFMRPDLGPKMYIAYGHGFNLDKGTTVLHLDISDAVNCMVYVGIPLNADPNHEAAVLKAIQESDCDQRMIERVTVHKELPGALWHIYRPCDADRIRDLINGIAFKDGCGIEASNDAIHDQKVYLDAHLRKRLREEYNVVGFPILQCAGDSVFIPAGAPHQVRNLHNCIKIAEDFVSPENVSHCFQLTEEFRNLSDTHSNHEDKLQIKNIVYHAVKDAMSVLMSARPLTQETASIEPNPTEQRPVVE